VWVQPTVRIALRMVFALVYSVLRLLLDVADVRLRVGDPRGGVAAATPVGVTYSSAGRLLGVGSPDR
jgi:hypothetical protein